MSNTTLPTTSTSTSTALPTLDAEQLTASTGGISAGWLAHHPYAADAFLDHHPVRAAEFTANHPFAAARIHRIAG